MRLVLSLVISSFFFFSPYQGNAGKLLGKGTALHIENCITANLLDSFKGDDYTAAHINSNHRVGYNSQQRFYPTGNFINPVVSQNAPDLFHQEKGLVSPHLYCKRIGLKLVFPEHYFW